MATKKSGKQSHYPSVNKETKVAWPLSGKKSGSQFNKTTKVPVIKDEMVGDFG